MFANICIRLWIVLFTIACTVLSWAPFISMEATQDLASLSVPIPLRCGAHVMSPTQATANTERVIAVTVPLLHAKCLRTLPQPTTLPMFPGCCTGGVFHYPVTSLRRCSGTHVVGYLGRIILHCWRWGRILRISAILTCRQCV
jgi:hypothetical protein